MPPARHTSAARAARADSHQHAGRRQRPRQVADRLPTSKVSWDRKFRIVMVLVFLLVAGMAVQAFTSMISAHSQANAQLQLVQKYAQENHRLEREAHALTQPGTILKVARGLGMVGDHEQAYDPTK